MDSESKTRELLKALDRRTSVIPRRRPIDSKISSLDPLPWKTSFSIFDPEHTKTASQLMKLLLAAKDFNDYMEIVDEVRQYENDGLFLYTLYSSVRHRDDTTGIVLPPIEERSPHWFFAAETIHEAIQLAVHLPDADHVVTNQTTAEVTDPESRVAYFREDIGMNRHHWSWHVVYPSNWDETETGKVKDRKGEIFYYMHQQMLARYDAERLSNGLSRVTPLQNFKEELGPYFPHLTSQTTGVHFSSRPPGMTITDTPNVTVHDMEMWRLRIIDAIDQGYVRDVSSSKTTLGNEQGIDIIAAVVEASSASVNREYYGNLHNMGHVLIASAHDPSSRFRQHPGVMNFAESAARDPIFYRWHRCIDNILNRHKEKLTPYTRDELAFTGIKISSAKVKGRRRNVMETFMREARSDLSHAPFLRTNGKILVQYNHLDHEPLTFEFKIENNHDNPVDVTIRVFLGPKYDESGNLLDPNQQRRLMIELDKISTQLKPGMNRICRSDKESSVTVTREIRSYRSLKDGNVAPEVGYCSCGWPEHLLIPKGTTAGMDFVLFVMCTDFKADKPDKGASACKGAISYCGSRDEKYPDTKPMGFPFDRRILASSMPEFLTENMLQTDVKIIFSNEVHPMTDWVKKMYAND